MHWCRVVMNNETKNLVSNLNYKNFNALEISGRHWKKFGFKTYTNVSYPEFDVCNITNEFIDFADIVILEQVLEHVKNPWKAIENIKKIVKVNGYVLITIPFLLKIHGAPMDYWRWTVDGIKCLLEDVGFQIITADSWGNKLCAISNFDEWTEYSVDKPLNNEKEFPLMVWALAKKI